jgi:hypothetical protein
MFNAQIGRKPAHEQIRQPLSILILLVLVIGCGPTLEPGPEPTDTPVPKFVLESPYQGQPTAYRYKAQTHAHSLIPANRLDTSDSASEVETAYRDKGYSVIFLTNHNTATDDPGVGCDSSGQNCIFHITSGESGWLCRHHLIVLANNTPSLLEWRDDDWANAEAMIALGVASLLFAPVSIVGMGVVIPSWVVRWNNACFDHKQERITKFAEDGSLVVIAHPQGRYKEGGTFWEYDELFGLGGYSGIEIISGQYDSRYTWDSLLTCQRRSWAFAADDCENIQGTAFNRGWIVVNSSLGPISDYMDSPQREQFTSDILGSIKAGNFYAVSRVVNADSGPGSTDLGPLLRIETDGQTIQAWTDRVDSTIRFVSRGNPLTETVGVGASYTANGVEEYIRVEVEQQRNGITYVAYSQPVFIKDLDPSDQGVEGQVTLNYGSADVNFSNFCGAYKHIIVTERTEGRFREHMHPGVYDVRVEDKYYEWGGVVKVPISGFIDLGYIDMKLKRGTIPP